jgi:hypothetical protein
MESTDKKVEERIRERAYHIWESNGRPFGRDEEFWRQASELIAIDDAAPGSRRKGRPRKKAHSQPHRGANRKPVMSAGVPAAAK